MSNPIDRDQWEVLALAIFGTKEEIAKIATLPAKIKSKHSKKLSRADYVEKYWLKKINEYTGAENDAAYWGWICAFINTKE